MKLKAIINGILFTGTEVVKDKALLIDGNRIVGLKGRADIPSHVNLIDAAGNYVAPGLIDLQVYGGGGCLFSASPSEKALQHMADALVKRGTTSFLPTLATNTPEVFKQALVVIGENNHPAILGLHFEGPWINPAKRGAHPASLITIPQKQEVEALLASAGGKLRMVTLAPEHCDPAIVQLLIRHQVVVSAGHSNATFDQAAAAFKNGITAVTHLFNAMSSFHHRETGLPGAAFQSNHVCASIIADGVHVDYQTLTISKRLMGDRLFLITDAVEESHEGVYIHVRKADRFTLPDGTLSGSCLTMLQAVANCVKHAGIKLEEALRMATLYPARLIGAQDLGLIATGYKANLLMFNERFDVSAVLQEGQII